MVGMPMCKCSMSLSSTVLLAHPILRYSPETSKLFMKLPEITRLSILFRFLLMVVFFLIITIWEELHFEG